MDSTEYTLRATICAPIEQLYEANQLACIVGENAADIGTFTGATHERYGRQYACVSTVVKPVFAEYQSDGLPDPPHAAEADREAAERAVSSLNQAGGVVFVLTDAATTTGAQVLEDLGMKPIPNEEEIDG